VEERRFSAALHTDVPLCIRSRDSFDGQLGALWEQHGMAAEERHGSAPRGGIWLNLTGGLPLFRRKGKHPGVRVSASAEGPDKVGRMDPHIRCFPGGVGGRNRSAVLSAHVRTARITIRIR
jgi:hypothetical protein